MKSLILILFLIPLIISQPDLITIINPNNFTFVPESLEWNTASNKFVVSDIYGGHVWQISDNGAATQFDVNQTGPNNCIGSGSFGLYYSSNTLLNVACGKFLSVPNASLPFQALYTSFSSGVLSTQVDLTNTNSGAPHIPNDLRPDGQGNIYLTDSFTPQIWKITNGVPSVFLFNHSTFYPTPFLDGIEINTNKGYLIVSNLGNSTNARLIKIPINNPSAATVVNIDNNGFNAFDGPDGIRFLNSDKTILLTTDNNGPEFRILKLQSTDDWVSAKIIGSFPVPQNNPSGVVVLPNGRIYYSTANSFTPGLQYVIGRATFSSASSFSFSSYSIIFCFLYLLTWLF